MLRTIPIQINKTLRRLYQRYFIKIALDLVFINISIHDGNLQSAAHPKIS